MVVKQMTVWKSCKFDRRWIITMTYRARFFEILSVIVFVGLAFAPVASAETPPGDEWMPSGNGCWYRGNFWQGTGQPFTVSGCEPGVCPSHRVYYDPQHGYFEYWCPPSPGAVMPPVSVAPQPTPPPIVLPPTGPQVQACTLPGTTPFNYDTPWGTFVTFDNWARAFYRYNDRCPTEADIWDFWATQGIPAACRVDVDRGCLLVDP